MRLITIILVIFACLILGCSDDPLTSKKLDSIEGRWIGISWMTHPGPADEPITDSLEVHFTFLADGTFIYGKREREPIMPLVVIYQGEYTLSNDSIILTVAYSHPDYSPLHLEGAFELSFANDSASLLQVLGDGWPNIYDVKLIPGEYSAPYNPLEGEWQGFSKVTYPGAADEEISDSVEIMISFDEMGQFSYHWVGDEISFPVAYDGEYSLKNDTVNLSGTAYIPYRTPLKLAGEFEISRKGDSLRLYQRPPHSWPDSYEVRLVQRQLLP